MIDRRAFLRSALVSAIALSGSACVGVRRRRVAVVRHAHVVHHHGPRRPYVIRWHRPNVIALPRRRVVVGQRVTVVDRGEGTIVRFTQPAAGRSSRVVIRFASGEHAFDYYDVP